MSDLLNRIAAAQREAGERLVMDDLRARGIDTGTLAPAAPRDGLTLSDGHTTLKEALETAREMHDLAEEFANECSDSDAAVVSKGAAIIEMMAAELSRICTIADGLVNHCDKDGGECRVCSVICCPLKDPLHFHHDGCPSCASGS